MGAGLAQCTAQDDAVGGIEAVPSMMENEVSLVIDDDAATVDEASDPQGDDASPKKSVRDAVLARSSRMSMMQAKIEDSEGLMEELAKAEEEEDAETAEAEVMMELQAFSDPHLEEARESVSPEELLKFIRSCQNFVEPDAVEKLIEVADINQNGKIEISELFGMVHIIGQMRRPVTKAVLTQYQQQKTTVELTGHTLAAAMKMRCDTTGATYALYWVEADGKFVVAGSYVVPEHKTPLKERPGTKLSFIQQCEKMQLARTTRLAQVAETRHATFISDTGASEGFTRGKTCKEFGIKSLCIIPFEDGVLEYGSLSKWEHAPEAPTMPKAQMKDAFETFGASYVLFWAKREEGFVTIAEYVTPQSKKATRNRRGNEDTFASKSRLLTLGPTSSVAKAFEEKREVFIPDATDHGSFTRANLATEFGIKTIRNVPCPGGVLEYGIPKDEHLEGHSLDAVLKLRCDMANAAYAIYWVEMSGQYVVGGHYTIDKVKEMLQNERGSTHGYCEECESLKLGTNTMLASVGRTGKDVFVADCANAQKFTRTKLCTHFGIKSIHFFPITGGVFECGNIEAWPTPPVCPMVPTAQLKTAFNKFAACYVMLWGETDGEWSVIAHYTTPEYLQKRRNSNGNSNTFCSQCAALKLNDDSMVAFASRSTSKQKIEDLRKPTKYTSLCADESTRMALAKEFQIQSVVIMPCGSSTVLEYGKAARDNHPNKSQAAVADQVMGA